MSDSIKQEILEAKKKLYSVYLTTPPPEFSESDLNIMDALVKDDQIQLLFESKKP